MLMRMFAFINLYNSLLLSLFLKLDLLRRRYYMTGIIDYLDLCILSNTDGIMNIDDYFQQLNFANNQLDKWEHIWNLTKIMITLSQDMCMLCN